MNEMILILDFGSQYTQLIARRVRELNVYCEIHPFNKIPAFGKELKGVILSGSPYSVRTEGAPNPDISMFRGKVPMLAVCYGAQLLAQQNGGNVMPSKIREYGRANLSFINPQSNLLHDIPNGSQVWMSHGDTISVLPDSFEVICSTSDVKAGGFKIQGEETYGIQFHPEVYHSTDGMTLLRNFIIGIAKCSGNWTPNSFVETTVAELKAKLGQDRVLTSVYRGGVDSSVACSGFCIRLSAPIYTVFFVDNGLLRKNEFQNVLDSYKNMGLNVKGVDASCEFYAALSGITEPEAKRKAIGKTFIDVFDAEAKKNRRCNLVSSR